MAGDIIAIAELLLKMGLEIQERFEYLDQTAEDLKLLNTNLRLLRSTISVDDEQDELWKNNRSELLNILDFLQSVEDTCKECAKALGLEIAGAEITTSTKKTNARGKRFKRQFQTWFFISDHFEKIRRKAEQLGTLCNTVSAIILYKGSKLQRTSVQENMESKAVLKPIYVSGDSLDLGLKTDFAGIDQMITNLLEECKDLRRRLQEATLFPDTSTVQDYQNQNHNPEGVAFWKDRFQNGEIGPSALRYETIYVSWARFVHEIETSFILNRIPTAFFAPVINDLTHEQGPRYGIDKSGTRRLATIRPLWLPALRSALDPLHKGYVKPQNFFQFLHDSSLSHKLRSLTLENAGYGILVECERASGDLPFPAAIESPSDHVGWICGQIVAVPTPAELGIVTDREVMEASADTFFNYFTDTAQDVYFHVRYLQTGQIERKSLSRQIRPISGISVGAAVSIRQELESGIYAWSRDLHITEFKACYGGKYVITAGIGVTGVVFCTMPFKTSSEMLPDDDSLISTIPELEFKLLGPSRTFTHPPKVGEKIQIEHEGLWYDSRVTVVDGDEIEYVDWESSSKQTSAPQNQNESESDEDDIFGFTEDQFTKLGKGTRRLWRPWRRDIQRYDVRPYRCFHIGDSIEAPVMYPDYRFHYHTIDKSQLYLPARIVDVQGDQYLVEFSPALSVHRWWPGRMAKGQQVDLIPGSHSKVENPFDFNTVLITMDRIQPFSEGPRPTLGVQSAKPPGWNSFQGFHLSRIENLLEETLWNNDQDNRARM
ncbi:hypothetical protein TWF730_010480 [Orbilia blumenaviensis]|uniref:Uncharacterized protein n=1 Tax=Orbilia blumenaviensis TaxID=1796055 RepID=A0AAV9UNE0_9PEZI